MPPAQDEATKMDTEDKAKVIEDGDAKPEKQEEEEEDLSDEDLQLKQDLEMALERLQGADMSLHRPALEILRTKIRESTSSMTSVPKPLKFLRPHYEGIKTTHAAMAAGENQALAADILSLLAMTSDNGKRECLKYRQLGSNEAISSWGHEYVRHLQGEITEEYKERTQGDDGAVDANVDDLIALTVEIVPFFVTHNAEIDACDLLMEIDRLDLLEEHVDSKSYERVCMYLQSCVPYVAEPDDAVLLKTCLSIFRKFDSWPSALQVALKLNDIGLIKDVFYACPDKAIKRQLAFMLGRQQVMLDLEEDMEDEDEDEIETLISLVSNTRLNESFLALARELDITDPKVPEDIYKTHLESNTRSTTANVDSARANLSATFVNAFVNAGFGMDKMILGAGQGSKWMYQNKDHGMMSAAASLGMILLWDVDGGLSQIDAYMLSEKDYIKAGALLGIGIVNSGVHNDCDPALALLQDYAMHATSIFRVGANMGLGLAYAGSTNEIVKEILLPVLEDSKSNMEVLGVTAVALGQTFVGSCDGDVAAAITTVVMTKAAEKPKDLVDSHARNLALGLGLLFLGKQQQAEPTIMALKSIEGPFSKVACMLVDTCAYAGTGNVLKVQSLLHACSEHVKEAEEGETEAPEGGDAYQGFAVLGIALVAMGEDIGIDMALRSFNHLLQYGEPVIRRAVPVATALLCVSNPRLDVLDTLSKLSHDADPEVAYNAVLAMGLVGAGTNHARIAGLLRHLAQYYHKDPNALFMVRLAQGILHSGKGSITMSPFHTDRTLMSPVAVSGLLGFLVGNLDIMNVLLKSGHYNMYHLALAMWPRILSTFDEDLNPLVTSVRVGQAVDVVGQAGKPKTITGFVTNSTPVLLGYGERAQLATEEYLPQAKVLEGFVIVKKNPEYE